MSDLRIAHLRIEETRARISSGFVPSLSASSYRRRSVFSSCALFAAVSSIAFSLGFVLAKQE